MLSKLVFRLTALVVAGATLGCAADLATTPSVTAVSASADDKGAGRSGNQSDDRDDDRDDERGEARTLTFATIGDMPYGQRKLDSLPLLLDLINHDTAVGFTIHVGDIKSGSKSPCTDAYFANVEGLFNTLQRPFIYTPGDNEWTDCHQPIKSNGVYTPTERLAAIRKLFFPVVGRSLGQTTKSVFSQAFLGGDNAPYVENVTWRQAGVTFGTINITGSNDDLAPWGTPLAPDAALWPSQADEHAARQAANFRWIRRIFAEARESGARGIVLAYQADMWDPAEPTLAGFDGYVDLIGQLAAKFRKPVLLLHGDSHVWRTDKPFVPSSPFFAMHPNTAIAPNVTRVVMSGSGNRTSYTRVTIDRKNPNLFGFVEVPLP